MLSPTARKRRPSYKRHREAAANRKIPMRDKKWPSGIYSQAKFISLGAQGAAGDDTDTCIASAVSIELEPHRTIDPRVAIRNDRLGRQYRRRNAKAI